MFTSEIIQYREHLVVEMLPKGPHWDVVVQVLIYGPKNLLHHNIVLLQRVALLLHMLVVSNTLVRFLILGGTCNQKVGVTELTCMHSVGEGHLSLGLQLAAKHPDCFKTLA